MSALGEIKALLDRAIEEAVDKAVAENNREWEDWLKTGLAISYTNAGGPLAIEVFDRNGDFATPLVQETLLNILSGEIDAVSEMPRVADTWIAALEEVVTAFRDAQRAALVGPA